MQLLLYFSTLAFIKRAMSKLRYKSDCYDKGQKTININSVAQSYPTLCNPMDCSTPGFRAHHQLPELAQTHVHQVGDAIQPSAMTLCHPLLLLLSVFPSNRVFSSEAILCIMWPKYWSFNFSINPSNEYSGLISFRVFWFDLLAVQGTLESLHQHHSFQKHQFCSVQPSLWTNSHIRT